MLALLSRAIASVAGFLHKEFVAAWPVFVFFLAGFLLLILITKLTLAAFSIELTAVSNAVVGALIAAKAALILDETPLSRTLEEYRRIVAVGVKTLLYGLGTLALGYLERILEALRKAHSFNGAVQYVIEHGNHDRLIAWALGISIVFALYFSFSEISLRMGEGALMALFFESPRIAKQERYSTLTIAKR
jgi:hypothetical protein